MCNPLSWCGVFSPLFPHSPTTSSPPAPAVRTCNANDGRRREKRRCVDRLPLELICDFGGLRTGEGRPVRNGMVHSLPKSLPGMPAAQIFFLLLLLLHGIPPPTTNPLVVREFVHALMLPGLAVLTCCHATHQAGRLPKSQNASERTRVGYRHF